MNRQKGTAVTQQSESQHYTHMSPLDRKYEYIDMDKVAEHMSPARTADHTDYVSMTNPQYSNLK